jgi:hypothetical protein
MVALVCTVLISTSGRPSKIGPLRGADPRPGHTVVGTAAGPAASSAPALPTVSIADENKQPGNPDWPPPDKASVWAKVSGWADHVSAQRGDTVGLYVSTAAPTFHVVAVRLGWYSGARGRIVWQSAELPGTKQPAPRVDQKTGMRDAPWKKSTDITVGADWTPGMYVLKLVSADGGQSMVPLTVRDDTSHSALLIGSGVTTWQAYNGWGGASLYTGGPKQDPNLRAKVVSFDRPYDGNGSGELFGREDSFIAMVEAMGLDVSYTTDVDVDAHPELLLNHRAYVAPTHDEYWSLSMRNGVESARDKGVNVLFMGANASFRRIRLEPSSVGDRRHEVNYRVASDDPLNGKDNAEVTTSWRDLPSPRPESSMIGDYYECNPVDAPMVIAEASSWIFNGTGWKNGDQLAHVVGNEYDRVTPEAPTPHDIEVVTHSPVTCRGHHSYSDMSYYTAPSGAGVLATGTFGWEPHLGPPCPQDPAATPVDCAMRTATANVLAVFLAGPAGQTHPSKSNLAALGIHAGYTGKG